MASEQDFDDLVENPAGGSGYALMGGATPAWPRVVRILKSLKGVFKAIHSATPDQLDGLILGNNSIRIFAGAAGNWQVQVNTGTTAAPVWTGNLRYFASPVSAFVLDSATVNALVLPDQVLAVDRIALQADDGIGISCNDLPIQNVSELQAQIVSVLDELDMNGRPIVNAGAVAATAFNGFSLGGSVTPEPVGTSNVAGDSDFFARANHEHQGIHEIDVDGAGNLHGDVNLISGDRISIVRAGQNITVNLSPRKQTVNNGSGADQIGIVSGADTNVAGLSAIPITGANGARTFRLSLHMNVAASGTGNVRATIYVGANGTLTDGSGARVCEVHDQLPVIGETQTLQIAEFEFVPASGDKIGVVVNFDVGGTGTVYRQAPLIGQLSLHHV